MLRRIGVLVYTLSCLACGTPEPSPSLAPHLWHQTQVPQIGWTATQVQQALGVSHEVTQWANGLHIWRYGLARPDNAVLPLCARESRCLSVSLRDAVVTDVTLSD